MTAALIALASFFGAFIVGSFFEWALHKYLMHGVLIKAYPYKTHDLVHHKLFGPGPTYHLGKHPDDDSLVTMAWWNAPLLMLANAPVPCVAAYFLHSYWVIVGAMAGYITYYALYEYLHWCMHVPGPRWFQTTRLFKWIDQHHRLHHLQPMRNLNVVFPLADYVLRTRLSRAPVEVPESEPASTAK